MSHYFDAPTAQEEPRTNLCDLYLFRGRPGHTVMAMTVNPDAGLSAPDTFREEGIYALRFDLDGDDGEEVTFKARLGVPAHAQGDEHAHVQKLEIRRTIGPAARRGVEGEVIAAGDTGRVFESHAGVRVFAGRAPDLFACDAAALRAFRIAFYKDGKYDPTAFANRKNFFVRRIVTAIVLEVPTVMIGHALVRGWAAVSLYAHAPEVQVSRWGLPLITNFFTPDADMKEQFNRATHSDDQARFIGQIREVAERLTRLAGSAADPTAYADQLIVRLFPTMLPYELNAAATFDFAGFNGPALTDDVMDVILTLATNSALTDGVAPDRARVRSKFPHFGPPYTRAEQSGMTPARPAAKR